MTTPVYKAIHTLWDFYRQYGSPNTVATLQEFLEGQNGVITIKERLARTDAHHDTVLANYVLAAGLLIVWGGGEAAAAPFLTTFLDFLVSDKARPDVATIFNVHLNNVIVWLIAQLTTTTPYSAARVDLAVTMELQLLQTELALPYRTIPSVATLNGLFPTGLGY